MMAKFCPNCGSALNEGAKHCTECGTPVAPPAQTQQTQQAEARQMQRQCTPKSQVYIPEEFAKKNAARAEREKTPPKKKNSKGGKRFLVILLAAVIGLAGFFGFRDGGWFRRSNSYGAQHMQSLLAYARQLEKTGSSEAAAAVYELIAQGGGAELIEKAREDIPAVRSADEIKQIEEVFDHMTGGDGR